MRRLLLIGLGAGVGYVMGTRAGRGRYLEMKDVYEKLMNDGSLIQATKKLSETTIGKKLKVKHRPGPDADNHSS